MQPKRSYWTLAAAADNNICQSQTPGAGNLTLNGALVTAGVANLVNGNPLLSSGGASQRRVRVTLAGDETGKTITLFGTRAPDGFNASVGQSIIETIAGGAPGTFDTLQDFATITAVSISAAAAGAIKVGTNGLASTPWVMAPLAALAAFKTGWDGRLVSGAVTHSLEYTADPLPKRFYTGGIEKPLGTTSALVAVADNTRIPYPKIHPGWNAATGDAEGVIDWPYSGCRVSIASGTGLLRLVYQTSPLEGN